MIATGESTFRDLESREQAGGYRKRCDLVTLARLSGPCKPASKAIGTDESASFGSIFHSLGCWNAIARVVSDVSNRPAEQPFPSARSLHFTWVNKPTLRRSLRRKSMPSNPTYPGQFGHTWDEREPFGPARTPPEDDEPVELPLHRRWPAVVIASALIVALGAGLLVIQRSVSRVSLGPTEELPMQPREFEPSLALDPAWVPAPAEVNRTPESAATSPVPAPATPPPLVRQAPAPRQSTPPPRREPSVASPPPASRSSDEPGRAPGIDFGSPDTLRPPDEPMLDPNDLAPREAAEPASDDMPDADAPDADIPDGDVPDADAPDAEPPATGDADYSRELGF
jgi:hypothetical protein